MSLTTIEWTDRTWNPVTGCTQVSPGCDHCYAKTLVDTRLSHNPKSARFGTVFERVMLHEDRLSQPFLWPKPSMVFVNSMSDIFHRDVPNGFIARVFGVMVQAQLHTFQVLTKRPERMRRWLRAFDAGDIGPCVIGVRNIWLGVSIESSDYAWRADMLRETPAGVRFLSLEPLLGPVDRVDFAGIDWVIVGGESGRGARAMDPQWVRDIRDRCSASGIPFFFKQWGGETKKRGHEEALLDGLRHVAWPERKAAA